MEISYGDYFNSYSSKGLEKNFVHHLEAGGFAMRFAQGFSPSSTLKGTIDPKKFISK